MANQRLAGKRLIGAQASQELWRGVDEWLARNPENTVSDFVLRACLEKLALAGIVVDGIEALRDLRGRKVVRYPSPAQTQVLNDAAAEEVQTATRAKIGAAAALNDAASPVEASAHSQTTVSTTYKTGAPGVPARRRRGRPQILPGPLPK